jgi:hypothetical protein
MKKILSIIFLGLLLSGNAYAKVKTVEKNENFIILKYSSFLKLKQKKLTKLLYKTMMVAKDHCNSVGKSAYWFLGYTHGDDNQTKGIYMLDGDLGKNSKSYYHRIICSKDLQGALRLFKNRVANYNSDLALNIRPREYLINAVENRKKIPSIAEKKKKKVIVKKVEQKSVVKNDSRIDWEKRNLCKNSEFKELCSKILNQKLVGLNTMVDFKFDKGKIIALINLKKGENKSLLTDPDLSYVAQYSGQHLVYKNVEGIFITEFVPVSGLKHFICDSSNNCIDVISLQWSVEKKKDNPAEERNKLLISCLKDNRETSIKLKNTECEAYADGEAVDIGDDSGNPNEFSEMSKKNENLKKKEEKYFDDNRYFKCYGEMTNAHKTRGFHQSNRNASINVKEAVCSAYAEGEEINYEGKR